MMLLNESESLNGVNGMNGFAKGNALWVALCVLALFFALVASASADVLRTVPSTPDLAVTGTATSSYPVQGGAANWVFIQNDCSDDLYFDLSPKVVADANSYPLRLPQDGQFSGSFHIGAVGVSPAAGNSACTFTVQFGR